jgi:hypothetical protein
METPVESRQCAAVKTPPLIAARSRAASTGQRREQRPANLGFEEEGDGGHANASGPSIPLLGKRNRPCGQKIAKEEKKVAKQRETAIRAHVWATVDMAAANFKKAQILQDQAALSLFTMPEEGGLSELAQEYLEL